MSVVTPPVPSAPAGGRKPSGRRLPTLPVLVVLAVVAAVGLGAAIVVTTNGTAPDTTPPTTTPATAPPVTSTTSSPPTTLSPDVAGELAGAVYPTPGSGTRFGHPVAAARSFAVDFVGFVNPVVGRFVATGAESGTVGVRQNAGGALTTVQLHRVAKSWWVLGSSTPDIRLDAPAASAAISSPVLLRGVSTAFEAQVNVEIRQDGARTPIGTGHVMGGSMGTMGPFGGSVPFSAPSAARGALVLSTVSMQSGTVFEATVVRVAFAPTLSLVPSSACPDYAMSRPAPPPGQMVVTVFYSCSLGGAPVPTYRLSPTTTGVLRNALNQLLGGPSAAERAAGLTSWFSSVTAGYVRGVNLSSGRATVELGDLRPVIPNASTSAGARMLLSQLDATMFQFPTVTSVVYRIGASCQTFGEWLQLDGCTPRTPSTST